MTVLSLFAEDVTELVPAIVTMSLQLCPSRLSVDGHARLVFLNFQADDRVSLSMTLIITLMTGFDTQVCRGGGG